MFLSGIRYQVSGIQKRGIPLKVDADKEVNALRKSLNRLQKDLQKLKLRFEEEFPTLEDVLRRRGIKIHLANPTDDFLLPPRVKTKIQDEFYHRLNKYSFRLFLRDLIGHRHTLSWESLTKFCSLNSARKYLEFLSQCRVVKKRAGHFQLTVPTLRTFGGTLEWYVAQIFCREFKALALWGLRLQNTGVGGDYDVLAYLERNLIYLEVKSSPPKHIDQSEVDNFWERLEAIAPNFFIFLVDTELRMKDKLVPMFEAALSKRFGLTGKKKFPVERYVDELFMVGTSGMIVNSKPNLIYNLGLTLRKFLGGRR